MSRPQDVYSGVADLVERERQRDAEEGLPVAQILAGHIQRKVRASTCLNDKVRSNILLRPGRKLR